MFIKSSSNHRGVVHLISLSLVTLNVWRMKAFSFSFNCFTLCVYLVAIYLLVRDKVNFTKRQSLRDPKNITGNSPMFSVVEIWCWWMRFKSKTATFISFFKPTSIRECHNKLKHIFIEWRTLKTTKILRVLSLQSFNFHHKISCYCIVTGSSTCLKLQLKHIRKLAQRISN